MDTNDAPKARLAEHLHELDPFSAALHCDAAPLLGHAMLDLLEEAGLGPEDIDAVGGVGPLALAISTGILHAAASRGQYLDAFSIEGGAIAGPTIVGRRVVVVDYWDAQGAAERAKMEGADVRGMAVVVGESGLRLYAPSDVAREAQ
ncbi:hypothetical protein V3M78_02295 [Trueperella pyogenes]|uniref:hypothetical protein n=1 Tax=Trueperella pyogenes TaxID=1661 RepID=UPI000C1B6C16|nr:hypothetical protein [Trueperella pyogenes]PIN51338.1 hypothetical protein CT171_06450 [Trueperella pyogenes]